MLIHINMEHGHFKIRALFNNSREVLHSPDPLDSTFYDYGDRVFADPSIMRTMGKGLYRWLFGTPQSPTPLYQGSQTERIYLFFDIDDAVHGADMRKLAALPWETLLGDDLTYVARDAARGVFRIAGLNPDRPLPQPGWPLRIVAASGHNDPDGPFGPARMSEQLKALRKVFVRWGRSAHIEVIEHVTNEQLRKAVRDDCPTILHFCGHGRHLDGSLPSLITAGSLEGQSAEFTADEIADMVREPIHLVTLCACQSAPFCGKQDDSDQGDALVHAFLRHGSKAVVAMQADIQAEAATPIVARLYEECLEGHPIEWAMGQARDAILRSDPAWAIPTLTLASLPAEEGYRLFDRKRAVTTIVPFGSRDEHSPRFTADFHTQRRAMFKWASREGGKAEQPAPVMLLTGDAGGGKTHFMGWTLSNAAHLGYRIRYTAFSNFGVDQKSLVNLLRAVRDGGLAHRPDVALCQPFTPDDAFSAFNAELNALLAEVSPAAVPDVSGPVADDHRVRPTSELGALAPVGRLTFNEHIADRFAAALRLGTVEKPAFIAIDMGDESFAPTEFATFLDYVVIPELDRWHEHRDALPPIRFAFCCRNEARMVLLEPLFRWYRKALGANAAPPEITFRSGLSQEELSRYFHEMYWFEKDKYIEDICRVAWVNAKVPYTMAMCSKVTGVIKILDALPEILDHVGEMQ